MIKKLNAPVLASYAGYLVLQLIGKTNRIQALNRDLKQELKHNPESYIFAFWHSRLLLPLYIFQHTNVATLVSKSKDGEYVAQAMLRFGLKVSRGSSSRYGAQGLKGLLRFLQEGTSVAITPDGPRGPRERVQPGIIQLARLSGTPITPIGFSCTRSIRVNSWDRMMIPMPFGHIHYVVGHEIKIHRTLAKEEIKSKQTELEDELRRVTRLADERAFCLNQDSLDE